MTDIYHALWDIGARHFWKLSALVAASIILRAQSFPAQESSLGTDGHYPAPKTEADYRFDCGFARAEVRWRQERFLVGTPPSFSDALRVTLLRFSAGGHDVSEADLRRIGALFGRLARIEHAEAWCYDGSLFIYLLATPKADLDAYATRDRSIAAEYPEPRIQVIAISRAGVIRLEEPAPLDFSAPRETNRDRRRR